MEPQEYAVMRQVEATHWWYQALHMRVLDALKQHASNRPLTVLDAGCGTGGMLARLPEDWTCHGLDFSPLALTATRERGFHQLTRASVSQLPYANESFDVVLLLDVLYHRAVTEPGEVLREVHRVLRPGGIAIINVPAYNWLRSSHDKAIHTARRFSRTTVQTLICAANLRALQLTQWNTLLLPIAVGVRIWRILFPSETSDTVKPSRLIQSIGSIATRIEQEWLVNTRMPVGLSVFAVAARECTDDQDDDTEGL